MLSEAQRAAWERYRTERPEFTAWAESVQVTLNQAARIAGVRAVISVRAKDVASFAKKILTKDYADPWVKITDKIGARVVVDEPGDCLRILDALPAAGIELVSAIDDKLLDRPANELGYLGRHVQITTPALIDRRGAVVECELQVRTRAEDAWAVAEHRLKYKGVVELAPATERRIMRLVALVELFDQELEAAVHEVKHRPEYAVLRVLRSAEASYLQYVADVGDDELSVAVLREVLAAAPPDLDEYHLQLTDFAVTNRRTLQDIFDRFLDVSGGDDRYLLLSQPECIVIFERIATAPYLLAEHLDGSEFEPMIRPLFTLWGNDWPES